MKCRHCGTPLHRTFVDLGSSPPSNAYLTERTLHAPEKWFPLRILVCESCWLVQTEDFSNAAELFGAEYAYFSSFSSSWLKHAQLYVEQMVVQQALDGSSHVVEVAANDGYLLQYFKAHGIPCTGIEPTASTAAAARDKGIAVIERFFGVALAEELVASGLQADLMVANNVLAHVPEINDFVAGFARLLKPEGTATFEFPHLLRLIVENQFDTIYHEHFSYLSLGVVDRIFAANGLRVFDVQRLTTHGGSLRVFAERADSGGRARTGRVDEVLALEAAAGLHEAAGYDAFQVRVERCKDAFLSFLLQAKRDGKRVAAYGAAAKGNTLLNYAGVRPDLLSFIVDQNPAKQGKFMPGSRIPIVDETMLREAKPGYVIVLPWNLYDEIAVQLSYIKGWGGVLVTAIPALEFR